MLPCAPLLLLLRGARAPRFFLVLPRDLSPLLGPCVTHDAAAALDASYSALAFAFWELWQQGGSV